MLKNGSNTNYTKQNERKLKSMTERYSRFSFEAKQNTIALQQMVFKA